MTDKPKYRKPSLWNHARSLVQYVVLAFVFMFWGLTIFLLSLLFSPYRLNPALVLFARTVLFITGIRLRVHGREKLDPKKAYVVICNHVNKFDPFVIYAALHRLARGVEKEANFRIPFYGMILRRVGSIPIAPRGNTPQAIAAMNRAQEILRQNISIVILPEGTRTRTGRLGPFKKGAFHMAVETGTPIAPLVTVGMYNVNRRGDWHIFPGIVDCYFEDPIEISGSKRDDVAALSEKARKTMLERLEKA